MSSRDQGCHQHMPALMDCSALPHTIDLQAQCYASDSKMCLEQSAKDPVLTWELCRQTIKQYERRMQLQNQSICFEAQAAHVSWQATCRFRQWVKSAISAHADLVQGSVQQAPVELHDPSACCGPVDHRKLSYKVTQSGYSLGTARAARITCAQRPC